MIMKNLKRATTGGESMVKPLGRGQIVVIRLLWRRRRKCWMRLSEAKKKIGNCNIYGESNVYMQ
jgi:hypothetical protein